MEQIETDENMSTAGNTVPDVQVPGNTANFPPPSNPPVKTIVIIVSVIWLLVFFSLLIRFYSVKKVNTLVKTEISMNKKNVVNGKNMQSGITTNVWTGKSNANNNWNDSKNWSKGVPVNNQIIEINASKYNQPGNNDSYVFEDNIPGLTIRKLIIDGSVLNFNFVLSGEPITITNGIEDTVTNPNTNPYPGIPQFMLSNRIIFKGNQTIETSGTNNLTFYNPTGAAISIGKNTLTFIANNSSVIDVAGAVKGTGTIAVPDNAVGSVNGLYFGYASPDFEGNVVIGNGDVVGIGNENGNSVNGETLVDAFGKSTIAIHNGGAIIFNAANTNTFIVNNTITMSGNGVPANKPGTGKFTGALDACISTGQEGCGSGVHVNLTGRVTLSGNTGLGAQYGGVPDIGTPTGTTVSYSLSQAVTGNYSLSAVAGSNIIINK